MFFSSSFAQMNEIDKKNNEISKKISQQNKLNILF